MKHYIAMTDRLENNDYEDLFLVEVVLYDTITTEDVSDVLELTFINVSKALEFVNVVNTLKSNDLPQVMAIYELAHCGDLQIA